MLKRLDYVEIGKRIKKIRNFQNLTQEQLSEMADISKNYLSDIERAKSEGSLDTYYRIAEALHVSMDFLTGPISEVETEDYLMHKIKSLDDSKQELIREYVDFLGHLKKQ